MSPTNISILGVPVDENSSFLRGAAEAPPLIRAEFFCDSYNPWTETEVDLSIPGSILDCGDLQFEGVDAWPVIEAGAAKAIANGPAIFLGGDHSITHPMMRAVRKKYPELAILHFDAHPDIYHAYGGNLRSHASPFARIMEEGLADRLVQIGIRTATAHQREQIRRFGVELHEMSQWRDGQPIEFSTPVYITLDMDAIDPAYAPGVSHREPGGLSPRQILNVIQSLTVPIVGADIVEFNPRRDLGGVTAAVAAKMLKEIAGMMLKA